MTTDHSGDLDARRKGHAEPETRARRVARRSGAIALVALFAAIALGASAILHLASPLGREAARDAFANFTSSRIRGTMRIGEITRLDFDRLDLVDFEIVAPNGETVIRTARMGGEFRWSELFSRGTIELAPSYFDRSEIWLTPRGAQGQVNLVYAMEVPDGEWNVPLELNDIELIDNILHIELPGKPAVTMRDVHGVADLHVGHEFVWRLDENRGYADLSPIEAGFRHMRGRLRSDHAHPLVVRMILDVEIAEPGVRFDYEVPALAGREGEPYFELDLGAELGVSEDRDDCAEGDEEHCAAAIREEREMARRRAQRAGARERADERRAEREREAN